MEQYKVDQYKKVFEKYQRATLVSFGSPDQYQFRQNELMHALAEFILIPYWQYEREKHHRELENDGTRLQD